MLLRTFRPLFAGRLGTAPPLGALAVLAMASSASAQYFGGYNPCNPCQTVCAPVCQQTAMIVQPAYQTVPVTEYRQVKQTVMKPVTETKYVDREVTAYRPVTEQRTASVPVTSYQPVTTMRQVCQDRSYYTTRYVPNCRVSPCQYDPRPGLLGWMNRTGYEIRSAFTPRYTAYRQFVPNKVVAQVPTTRYVAQQGTRQVTYNVTKYEPYTTTQRVAVTETHMVAQEQTVTQPVTTYRTVPVGTTVAYAPVGSLGGAVALGGTISSVAYGPIQYGSGATATAARPDGNFKPVPSRTAENAPAPGKAPEKFNRKEKAPEEAFGPSPPASGQAQPRGPRFRQFSEADRKRILRERRLALEQDAEKQPAAPEFAAIESADELNYDSALAAAFESPLDGAPSSIRSVGWTTPEESGPKLIAPSVAAIQ